MSTDKCHKLDVKDVCAHNIASVDNCQERDVSEVCAQMTMQCAPWQKQQAELAVQLCAHPDLQRRQHHPLLQLVAAVSVEMLMALPEMDNKTAVIHLVR